MRKNNWPEKLDEVLNRYRATQFEYGRADCWLFVTDAISAITENTLYNEAIEASYTSLKSGLKFIKKTYGVKHYEDLPDVFFKQINPRMAQRGDLVMFNKTMGICIGAFGLFLKDEGLVHVGMTQCHRAWRVE